MQNPNFADYEYLSSAVMNAASSAVASNVAGALAATTKPGLVSPGLLSLSSAGLTATASMPAPFGVLFGNGVLANAHGTNTGLDTQTYAVSFSSVVPASGAAVTAYLLASATTIGQGAYQVTGPQPGHPDFNPQFVPLTAYALTVDTLSLAASTTPPDNVTTFALAQTTLASGATSLGTLVTTSQKLAEPLPTLNITQVVASKALTSGDAGVLQEVTTSGVFLTLPDASVFGRIFPFCNRNGATATIQTISGQLIHGFGSSPSSGIVVANDQAGALFSDGASWQVLYLSQSSTITQVPFGGTGRANLTSGAVLVGNGTNPVTLVSPTAANQAFFSTSTTAETFGTLPVAAGGTGLPNLGAFASLLYANGTSPIGAVAPPSQGGEVLWSFGASSFGWEPLADVVGTAAFKAASNNGDGNVASVNSASPGSIAFFADFAGTLEVGFTGFTFVSLDYFTESNNINFRQAFGNVGAIFFDGAFAEISFNFASGMPDNGYGIFCYDSNNLATVPDFSISNSGFLIDLEQAGTSSGRLSILILGT